MTSCFVSNLVSDCRMQGFLNIFRILSFVLIFKVGENVSFGESSCLSQLLTADLSEPTIKLCFV